MIQFQYIRVRSEKEAMDALAKNSNAMLIAGGTNLVDLMKRNVIQPEKLIDITLLPLKNIEVQNTYLKIGALALNSAVAEHPLVAEKSPLLSLALKSGASAQLRNMATVGGNLLQRTRCPYFYDVSLPCNKRQPGKGCGALEGYNRMHAIFGTSENCIAVHPSDMSVGLSALDAQVVLAGPKGIRRLKIDEFYRLPGDTPHIDNNMIKGELILGIEIPEAPLYKNYYYLKIRDRASYAFALVSVATLIHIENNIIKGVRISLGGVAHKPWRLLETEEWLNGKPVSEAIFKEAAEMSIKGANSFKHNEFKIKLAPNAILHALKVAAGMV